MLHSNKAASKVGRLSLRSSLDHTVESFRQVVEGVKQGYGIICHWCCVKTEQKKVATVVNAQAQMDCLMVHLACDCAKHAASPGLSAEEIEATKALVDSYRQLMSESSSQLIH